MTSALYSVSVTTLYGAIGLPDPFQVYAVLYSDGRLVDWPSTLTRISISDLPPITSISAITKSLFDQSAKVTGSRGYGQLHSDSVAVPWPATARGVIVADSATATSATSASSATSGTATPASTDTKTGTSNDPTSTSSPLPAVSSHSTGISTGATAGIAIGCALFGLAIGLLAAFCIVKRKGKRNSAVDNIIPRHELEAYPTDKVVVRHELEAYPPDKATPVSAIQLSQFLLEATPDQDIAHESQSIGALIDQHVESYYHRQPVTVGIRALASALNQLGFPLNTKSVALDAQGAAALCLDPQSRQVGLRHVLVRVLFSSIDVRSSYGPSMLPAPAASFLEAIPPAESDRFGDAQANALALREWRKLSAFLLHPARSQRTSLPPGDAVVAMQAQELASSFNSFLGFFVDQQHQHLQVGHLQAIIEECAKLGYMLFSHPSDWEFIYDAGGPTRGVVVEAGLCKLGGRDGAPSPSPQRLLEPVVVSSQSSR